MNKISDNTKYRKRVLDEKLKRYLTTFGAVLIEGPKWCGKTSIASFHSNSKYLIEDSSNNFQNKKLAEMTPLLALEGLVPRLIDEWQEVYTIWDVVRYTVDKRAEKGQFILTSSSIPKESKNKIHSGAGRIGKMRLRTMSLYESGDSSGLVSLKDICDGNVTNMFSELVDLRSLANYIVRGGFPETINIPIENAQLIIESYIDILNDDILKLDNKKYNLRKIRLLLKSLARNETTTVSISKLANDIKEIDEESIDCDSITNYLDIFERLFLTDNQKPFSTNIRASSRIKQAEKRHFCDPSIACALLKATPERLINDLETFGFLFEALCERDLRIYADSFDAQLFHYQDYSGKEIDAVIELKDGNWCAFEIKLGANQIDKAASNLIEIKDKITLNGGRPPKIMCVICGLSNAIYQRPDGVYVVPITALKN